MNNQVAISVSGLSKSYPLRSSGIGVNQNRKEVFHALKNISFDINKGENIVIIGANGSGKSTLLKILAGVTKPGSGIVQIRGKVASILDIGAGFHPELNGLENIYLNGQLLGFTKADIKPKVEAIIEFSGIGHFINEPVKSYSSGMFLRLAFSIVVHLDFDVYLFDEVLSVGDAEFLKKTQQFIAELNSDQNRTIVSVTHNMNEVHFDNKVFVLDQGSLETGDPKFLLEKYFQEKTIDKNFANLVTHNSRVKQFEIETNSKYIELLDVEIWQEEGIKNFRTDLPIEISFTYKKKSNEFYIDPMVSISNFSGRIILTTAPFVKGDFDSSLGPGVVKQAVVFPAYFFNSQIYFISVYFIRNAQVIFNNIFDEETDNLDEIKKTQVFLSLTNFIPFKLLLSGANTNADISNIDISGALLAGLHWEEKEEAT